MKQPAITKDLVPVHELRSDLARWLHHARITGRPVVVTQYGKATAVLMAPEVLDELEQERDVIRIVLRGLRDSEAGRVHGDDEVWDEVADIIEGARGHHEGPLD